MNIKLIPAPNLKYQLLKKHLFFLLAIPLIFVLIGCYPAQRVMYIHEDNSSSLFLSHYTSFFPSLGSCGFFRSEDSYTISVPRINGRIESNELRIYDFDTTKYSYTGYIEFLHGNKVYVDLYKIFNGVKTKLTINGNHTIKIKDNWGK